MKRTALLVISAMVVALSLQSSVNAQWYRGNLNDTLMKHAPPCFSVSKSNLQE